MSNIVVTRTYAQSPAVVFATLNDFAGIHRFHPLVEMSPLVEGMPATGAGSERVCHMYDGNTLHERLVEVEQDKSLVVDIVDTSMPMAKGAGRFDLAPTDDGGTELTMTMDFELKMGILGKALDALIVGRKFRGNLELLLAALDEHLATNESIPKGWKPSARS
ncbi:MAG: SRPBCC family protein [Proteobacteria bacterium]|nr:SRPBCC family protein [Pseudomonadota bacterium]MCP4916289.1 SRPBCC family protein [Pseudomonadota bacterium]